ncbi:conserved hypothetical protein [uncultured Pleomorphomonas sp.]|uniref:YspA cpYpsA-related SLOG domain-containing protein n=1 Tax=uncultured Pleomorphomonas sp. TaxID=442121 RepID=A0A212LQF9_9HYPH|nr:SLOG family protein [uncultured Pleomorphomonas sp.]SCM79818.1 conserved hypothetical protein [uncultured Pleomorphomonas sp.]
MTRIIVRSGPKYQNADRVFLVLDRAVKNLGMTVLIHSDAKGAESIAAGWAGLHGIETVLLQVDSKLYGKTSVPMLNSKMLEEGKPDYVIAFPGGWDVDDLIRKAHEASVKVYEIDRL